MGLPVYRLRRLLATTAVLLTLVVAGMYFYARSRATNMLKSLPGKIGYDIKQTASGFQFSKSDGKRTLFTVQATELKQFKLNGNAELHNVTIVLYGKDSSRFDRIHGEDFSYNQKTGDISATGDVEIDLVANPAGLVSPDQAAPQQSKNPIHLSTRDLVFNKETGDASTAARVEFRVPQASGSAIGVKYTGKSNTLTLSSGIHISLSGADAAIIDADSAVIMNQPREIVLEHPRVARQDGTLRADKATFFLSSENHVERVLAAGDVITKIQNGRDLGGSSMVEKAKSPAGAIDGRADEAEFLLMPNTDLLRTAILHGKVHIEQSGNRPLRADAGRVILDFAGANQLQKVHATDGAHLVQRDVDESKGTNQSSSPAQEFELTASVIDFIMAKGHILRHAVTSGPAQINVRQLLGNASNPAVSSEQQTVVTAGRFEADFAATAGRANLVAVRGAPNARLVNSSPGQAERVSTSDSVQASFRPEGGIDFITQTGNFSYNDGGSAEKRMQAWADSARYTPADQILVLNGNPRITSGAMLTTADHIRINRASGEALAEGGVKSTYSELKEQPDGALLASSSPIHVTAQSMTAQSAPGLALYNGSARLWQDANVIEAPSIRFDRARRSVIAQGNRSHPVQTTLVQPEKTDFGNKMTQKAPGQSVSDVIFVTADQLTYQDSERKVHYQGEVEAKAHEFTASAKVLDAYLMAHSQTPSNQVFGGPGQLDRMVAEGGVVIREPKRRATGQKLVYTTADDKFVLTGGPPSIFDAEQGKITGVSLTFFRRDDRVLVEGEVSTPVVTQTRVAR